MNHAHTNENYKMNCAFCVWQVLRTELFHNHVQKRMWNLLYCMNGTMRWWMLKSKNKLWKYGPVIIAIFVRTLHNLYLGKCFPHLWYWKSISEDSHKSVLSYAGHSDFLTESLKAFLSIITNTLKFLVIIESWIMNNYL